LRQLCFILYKRTVISTKPTELSLATLSEDSALMMKNYLSSYESDEEDDQNEEEEEKEEEEEEEELEEVSEEEEEEEESEDEFADEFAVADGIAQQYDFVVEYCLSVAAVVEHICKHCIARANFAL